MVISGAVFMQEIKLAAMILLYFYERVIVVLHRDSEIWTNINWSVPVTDAKIIKFRFLTFSSPTRLQMIGSEISKVPALLENESFLFP